MLDLLSEWLLRPLSAMSSGLQTLCSPGNVRQQTEAAFARVVHDLCTPPGRLRKYAQDETAMASQPAISAPQIGASAFPVDLQKDARILSTVLEYLARG